MDDAQEILWEIRDLKRALRVAADALDIADDWHVKLLQVNPPPEWGLPTTGDGEGGWCCTVDLAAKLREMAK